MLLKSYCRMALRFTLRDAKGGLETAPYLDLHAMLVPVLRTSLSANELRVCHCEPGLPGAAIHSEILAGGPRRFALRHDRACSLPTVVKCSGLICRLAMTSKSTNPAEFLPMQSNQLEYLQPCRSRS